MSWDWQYSSARKRWSLTVGEWSATVVRIEGIHYRWHASIERTLAPNDRYDGPTMNDAMDARTWCLTKIAELRASRPTDSEAL